MIAVLSVGVFSDGTTALGAHAQTHKQAHRAARCGKSARSHKRHGQHARRAKRHRRVRCAKRHSTTLKHSAGKSKPTTGGSRSKAHRPARSKSADNGCADAGLEPTPQNVERVRDATLCLINRERAAHGENPLRANQHLQQAAQDHTESMVVGNYFEHLGPGGQTPLQRMRAAGYIYSSQLGYSVGENIAWGTLWLGTPRSIVAAWMASPGHRANILDARYRDTGIGVSSHPPRSLAGGQGGGIYTQDFGVLVGG
ncbi:MAG TPA: CAP domain-containing protein [Solirubrobacteraceae bacterium]|nr:CAP domain-containing protein [Solirubrobacteraceae bacterium]